MLAKPARCSADIRKSPEPPTPSPVKTRPVRLAPCAAGARPIEEQPRARIAEARHGARPVRLVAKRAALLASDPLAVLAQPRAALAGDDGVVNGAEGGQGVQLVVGLQPERRSADTSDELKSELMRNTAPKDAAELDVTETREWLDSLDYVLQSGGPAKWRGCSAS